MNTDYIFSYMKIGGNLWIELWRRKLSQLTCENLTLGYDSKVIIKNLSFSVNAGDYLCILGENGSGKTTLTNKTYAPCVYTVGEMVYPDSWDDNRWNECSHGIHFFINRQEAVGW